MESTVELLTFHHYGAVTITPSQLVIKQKFIYHACYRGSATELCYSLSFHFIRMTAEQTNNWSTTFSCQREKIEMLNHNPLAHIPLIKPACGQVSLEERKEVYPFPKRHCKPHGNGQGCSIPLKGRADIDWEQLYILGKNKRIGLARDGSF